MGEVKPITKVIGSSDGGRYGSVLTRLRLDYTLLRFLSLAATPEPLVHADQLLSDEMLWAVLLFRSSSLLLAVTF